MCKPGRCPLVAVTSQSLYSWRGNKQTHGKLLGEKKLFNTITLELSQGKFTVKGPRPAVRALWVQGTARLAVSTVRFAEHSEPSA